MEYEIKNWTEVKDGKGETEISDWENGKKKKGVTKKKEKKELKNINH